MTIFGHLIHVNLGAGLTLAYLYVMVRCLVISVILATSSIVWAQEQVPREKQFKVRTTKLVPEDLKALRSGDLNPEEAARIYSLRESETSTAQASQQSLSVMFRDRPKEPSNNISDRPIDAPYSSNAGFNVPIQGDRHVDLKKYDPRHIKAILGGGNEVQADLIGKKIGFQHNFGESSK